jgi:hypothetical protein
VAERQYRLGVFDRPVLKDWAFWHAIAWSVAVAVSTWLEPIKNSTSSLWVDVPGVAATTFFVVGWPVAGVRRIIRMVRARGQIRGKTLEIAPPPMPSSKQSPKDAIATPATVDAVPTPTPTPTPTPPRGAPPRGAPPAPAPVPLVSYTGSEMRQSEVLTQARMQLPYPVARAARAVQTTQDPLEQYQYLVDLGEAVTLTLGMLSASWLRQHASHDPALEMLHRNYLLRGVSQGHWHEVTKSAEKAMAGSAFAVKGFVDGVRSRKGDLGALDALKIVLAERNRAAHGARPHNRAEAAVRIAQLAPTVIQAVDRAGFLAETPWALVEGVALRRQDRRWNARIRRAMGDHPDFDAATEVIDHPLANDTFYVMAEPEPLDLTPMLVIRYCEQCRQPEVCHADRVDERAGVSLKSFARGHQVFDRDLVPEVRLLIPSGLVDGSDGA